MVEYIKIPAIKLKVKDAFAMKDLLKNMEEWLKENGYKDWDGGSDFETLYSHKINGNWLDSWAWWRLRKYPPGTSKDTGYLRYTLSVDVHYLGDANEIDVMHKGKKVKMHKGELEVTLSPMLEMDFRNDYKKEGLLGLAHDYFRKRLYRDTILMHFGRILYEVHRFEGMMKEYFGYPTTQQPETVANPPKGLI